MVDNSKSAIRLLFCLFGFWALVLEGASMDQAPLKQVGVSVVPHVQSKEMRYRNETDFSLGARTQVFIQNTSDDVITITPDAIIKLRNQSPEELLKADKWAWYDFPGAWSNQPLELSPGALTVWEWNGKRENWGVGQSARMTVTLATEATSNALQCDVLIKQPNVWLSAVTFLGDDKNIQPDRMVFHIANETDNNYKMEACRLWLPESKKSWRELLPGTWIQTLNAFPANQIIAAHDRGGAVASTGLLPLTYIVLEVRLCDDQKNEITLWAKLRIKKERFDISGGWISSDIGGSSSLTYEPYLKTLKRMHINTGHIADVNGFTNNDDLYSRFPIKYFNKLDNIERFDSDDMLPRIHAVEFLGEPQYGGGRPVHPMEVWRQLALYQPTRLPTTVTHSEERIWRFYAGLSDYPHYDAYRVTAPSPDSWRQYERWGDDRIRWGAPLETIGVMTRSLRELNRPASIAYWSQGAHTWGHYGGRDRVSPTPEELRAQAYYALGSRITSLYWFNLSLKSLVRFPDLIGPITQVGREIQLLEDFYLEGDAYWHNQTQENKQLSWDLSVISGPRGAVLIAQDLKYQPDPVKKVFVFDAPRNTSLNFSLPTYMRNPLVVLKIESNTIKTVQFKTTDSGIKISDACGDVNVYIASKNAHLLDELRKRYRHLIEYENSFQFDPANNKNDYETLEKLLNQ